MTFNMIDQLPRVGRLGIAVALTLLSAASAPSLTQAATPAAPLATQHTHQTASRVLRDQIPALADGLIIKFAAQKAVAGEAKSLAQDATQQAQRTSALSAAAGTNLQFARNLAPRQQMYWLSSVVPASDAQAAADRLITQAGALGIESIELDYRLFPTVTPNDPRYDEQWHYQAATPTNYGMNLPQTWDIITGSTSLVVAVVDTGIRFNHPDLANRTVPGYDFISDVDVANDGDSRDADASDPGDWVTSDENASGTFRGCGVSDSSWHGTHVAGTIGAASNNNVGVAGVNWRSKILPVRVLGKCGGSLSDIVDGIRWAAGIAVDGVPANPNPARVINMSLGGPSACSPTYQAAINDVTARGVVIVVAAGNENTNASSSQPGNCNNVITIGSTRKNGLRASYSNYGPEVDISAPGGQTNPNEEDGVLSTLDSGTTVPVGPTYAFYQGTSMATPHVAGVVSLMLSVQPNLKPAQVLEILKASVTAFPEASDCDTRGCGTGILDAFKAVKAAQNVVILSTYLPSLMTEATTPPPDPGGSALANSNFEAGRTAWAEVSAYSGAHIIYSVAELQAESNTVTPHDGQYLAWLGGLHDENASITQNVAVPASATKLTFWHRISSGDQCGFDTAAVFLGTTRIYNVDLCTTSSGTTWKQQTVNISSFAGKTLALKFAVTTDEALLSSWYVDTIAFE